MMPAYKPRLAIKVIIAIAQADPNLIPAAKIEAVTGTSKRYIEPMLQRLGHFGLLEGIRGPAGGYRLARAADQITLGMVSSAMNWDDTFGFEGDDMPPTVNSVVAGWRQALSNITIAELIPAEQTEAAAA